MARPNPRRFLIELLALPLLSVLALLTLRWLHGTWDPGVAVACGLGGPWIARWIVRRGVTQFPPFLLNILDAMGGLLGLLLACVSTMSTHALPYWILKAPQVSLLLATVALLSGALVALVYTHTRMAREIEDREFRLAALREAALRAQLRALQAQINPHFLFNALNVLAELAHSDPDASERLVTDLAWLLRYTLRASADGTVTLGQEIEATERYLRIEQARLGDRLVVEIDVPDSLLDAEIPGLTLQPLVENAVKYAASATAGRAVVSVEGDSTDDLLLLRVHDNGPGLPDAVRAQLLATELPTLANQPATGTGGAGGGLANVQQRLALTFRGAARVVAEDTDEGTCLRLEVPR